jgi:hypothetical protein
MNLVCLDQLDAAHDVVAAAEVQHLLCLADASNAGARDDSGGKLREWTVVTSAQKNGAERTSCSVELHRSTDVLEHKKNQLLYVCGLNSLV